MRKTTLGRMALAAALAMAVAGYGTASVAQPVPDHDGWGPGMMGNGYGYGSWMMGPGGEYHHGGGYGCFGGAGPGPWMGPGMMYGYGPGGWMRPGMMGGYGPGAWMGPGTMYGYHGGWGGRQPADLNLSVAQVTTNMEHWLRGTGNPHVKLGTVTTKDADTITADVVTTDKDALVQRYEINRHTGLVRPAD